MHGQRCIWSGRVSVRQKLPMAALVASKHNPAVRSMRARLDAKGKPPKVALVALTRELLISPNAMLRIGTAGINATTQSKAA